MSYNNTYLSEHLISLLRKFIVNVIIFIMKYQCPKCGSEVSYTEDKQFPFCSKRCSMLDLGAWSEEEYKISRAIEERDLEGGD